MLDNPPSVNITIIASIAKYHQWRVMTAESCTGGLMAAALTEGGGASDWFDGAVVAYDNIIKLMLLQVPETVLEKHGAVSEQTARAMCDGLVKLGAGAGAAITGIAGPRGGTPTKPVGTVCFGIFTPKQTQTFTKHFNGASGSMRQDAANTRVFSGVRGAVREAAVNFALAKLAESLAAADTAEMTTDGGDGHSIF